MAATDRHRTLDVDIDSNGSNEEVFSLSEEQSAAATFIFSTGPTGTGSPAAEGKACRWLEEGIVTASTGIAAATIISTMIFIVS